MDEQLTKNIMTLNSRLKTTHQELEAVGITDKKYLALANHLLEIGSSYIALLSGFGVILDEPCIDISFLRVMSINCLLRYQILLLEKEELNDLEKESLRQRNEMIECLRDKATEDLMAIFTAYGLPNFM